MHQTFQCFGIGNSMICSDIWHKYHEWYFKIIMRNLRQFWNITVGIYAKYNIQIMLLFAYTTTRKRVVIFTCRYFKLSWNTTVLKQSNCRNFSCSSIKQVIIIFNKWKSRKVEQAAVVEKVDIVIHWVNHYPVKNTISFRTTYPSDSDLSGG